MEGREVYLGVRAEDIEVGEVTAAGLASEARDASTAENTVQDISGATGEASDSESDKLEANARAPVVVREPMGSDLYLTVDVSGNNVKVRTRPDVRFDRGDTVELSFDPEKIHLFDGDTGESLTTSTF